MNVIYHYPPELFQLLVDTIPRLCRSKRDVLTFFRGAGVGNSVTADIAAQLTQDRENINKYDIVRTVLSRLNETGDDALRERREVLKRVVEFEDFSVCWPNDRLEAQGLVAQIQRVINVKDSFTRMRQERDEEVRRHRETQRNIAEERRQRREALGEVLQDFHDLFKMDNAQKRGLLLENVMNRFFAANGILLRENFRRSSEAGHGIVEQIDGVLEFDSHIYLAEMKWLNEPVGRRDVSEHLVRIYHRGDCRGIFVSYSGYTAPAIDACRDALNDMVIVLCELQEFVLLMEQEASLEEFLKAKIRGSIIDKQPLTKVW